MQHPHPLAYTPEEDQLLITLWSKNPPPHFSVLREALPNRSAVSIRKRLAKLRHEGLIPRHIRPKAKQLWLKSLPDPNLEPTLTDALWRQGKKKPEEATNLLNLLISQQFRCALTGAPFTQRLVPEAVMIGQERVFVLPHIAKLMTTAKLPPAVVKALLKAIVQYNPPVLRD